MEAGPSTNVPENPDSLDSAKKAKQTSQPVMITGPEKSGFGGR